MKRTFELAKNGLGFVSPNPLVGAVICRNGEIISEGWHSEFGGSHAEVNAIANSGLIDFSDCELIVNLEPCSHYGKTPPCTDLIIEKQFKKVVIAMTDPNPLAAGKGIEILKNAGIEVETGILENDAKYLNRFFSKHITYGTPFILAKVAQSIDGCIATLSGESKWITSDESRAYSHKLRSEVDAVLIGKNTAQKDNPKLNVRLAEGRNPKKIVLDTNLTLPLELELFRGDERENTFLCCSAKAASTRKADALRLVGVKVISSETNDEKKLDIEKLLRLLYINHQIGSVMVEGGTIIQSSFAKNDIIDEIQFFISPILIGGGLKSFGNLKINKLADSKKYTVTLLESLGNDIHLILKKGGSDIIFCE
jgi:diaminohydroxyphosphoribosylaminopyrimidine deaminase/5-amino-6-(5-phosphoribosylamino)uracil reductase